MDQILNGTTGWDDADKTAGTNQAKKLNEDVTPQMISKYIDKLKARGELAQSSEAIKQPSTMHKLDLNKKIALKSTKAVNVTACGFNDSVGLLALALIDKEVKIYNLKQNGSKIGIEEIFSFYVSF